MSNKTIQQQELASDRAKIARIIEQKTGRAVGEPMDADHARKLTDQIKRDIEGVWDKIKAAYLGRAWVSLGYATWDEYTIAEFESVRGLRLPREDRTEVVRSLRDAGLSVRAIASVTDLSIGTVHSGVKTSGVQNRTVDDDEMSDDESVATVIGIDGKRHPTRKQNWVRVSDGGNDDVPDRPRVDGTVGKLVQLGEPHGCGGRCENCLARRERRLSESASVIDSKIEDLASTLNADGFEHLAEPYAHRLEAWIDTLQNLLDALKHRAPA